jgi:hypothetical protein
MLIAQSASLIARGAAISERHDLIMRCIGGMAPTRERVETHLARAPGREFSFQWAQVFCL